MNIVCSRQLCAGRTDGQSDTLSSCQVKVSKFRENPAQMYEVFVLRFFIDIMNEYCYVMIMTINKQQ